MIRSWLSSRQTQVLGVVGLIVLERLTGHLFDMDPGFGLAGETGLLLWGIGHCDTMDGPLVKLAVKALEEKNVNLVLPWVGIHSISDSNQGAW